MTWFLGSCSVLDVGCDHLKRNLPRLNPWHVSGGWLPQSLLLQERQLRAICRKVDMSELKGCVGLWSEYGWFVREGNSCAELPLILRFSFQHPLAHCVVCATHTDQPAIVI
jgi:hypothetical protein